MAKTHRIRLGEQSFQAASGQNLLEAALAAGVELPHDCRAGRCGTCLTRVREGITMGGETHQPGMVHACRAMVFSNLSLECEPVPPVVRAKGRVARIAEVAADTVEVTIAVQGGIELLPGQYCRFRFRGYPERPFSPTAPMAPVRGNGNIHLHVKRVRDGRVTPHLGTTIRPGHPVTIDGPFGQAFLRAGGRERLVLVGSGTGFAPMWAVAAAALREQPSRPVVLVAATRRLAQFYMAPALALAGRFPGVTPIGCVETLTRPSGTIAPGSPLDHLPTLLGTDIVYAGGAPAMVEAVGKLAAAVGATFYRDPFEPAAATPESWMERAMTWLATG